MSDKLTERLRGRYEIGPDGEFGIREFGGFIPPVCFEAAKRIDELEEALKLIQSAGDVSENPLSLIENICADAIGVEYEL